MKRKQVNMEEDDLFNWKRIRDNANKTADMLEKVSDMATKRRTPMGVGIAGARSVPAAQDADDAARAQSEMAESTRASVDPELIAIGVSISSTYVNAGIRRFEDYARQMKHKAPDLWDKIKPYLLPFWSCAIVNVKGAEELSPSQARAIIAEIDRRPGFSGGETP